MTSSRRGAASPDAWETWARWNVAVGDDGVTLPRADLPTYERARAATIDPADPLVDVALAPCGDPYVLTAGGAVYRYDPARAVAERLACVWQATGDPRALCVTGDTIYVAGTALESAGNTANAADTAPGAAGTSADAPGSPDADGGAVQAVSRIGGQTRWTATGGVDPVVAMARVDGRVYLLCDPGTRGTGWIGQVCQDATVDAVVTGLLAPRDLAADADGRLWVLDELVGTDPDGGEPVVRRFDADALAPGAPVDATDSVHVAPAAFRIAGTGETVPPTCLAVGAGGHLLVGVDPDWQEQLAVLRYRPADGGFERQPALEAGCRALAAPGEADAPRAYAVSAAPTEVSAGTDPPPTETTPDGRATAADGRLHVVDGGYRTQRDGDGATAGRLVTRFAADEAGVQWHRVELARSLAGPESEVRVRYHATDAPEPAPEGATDGDWDAPALESLDGLGETYADRLRAWGVADLADLAEHSAEAVQSIVAVEEVDVAPATVESWQAAARSLLDGGEPAGADVEVVDGVGPTYAARLRAGGLPDLDALVAADAAAIARIVSAGTLDVALDRARAWVRAARDQRPERASYDGLDWTAVEPASPRDALLDGADGRYLWVEIELVGTVGDAPTVRSVHAEFPRETYLEELPALYRTDEASADFLARYLSLFERIFTDVETAVEHLTSYLDPRGIPAEAAHLAWLGSFLGVDVDGDWPTPVARTFVERAPELYRMRGTRRGLFAALSIYLDHAAPATRDWERAREREDARLDGLVAAGLLTDAEADAARAAHEDLAARAPAPTVTTLSWADLACAGDSPAREFAERLVGCRQGFLVLLHPRVAAADVRALAGIVAAQAPAHASVRTVGLRRRVQLAGTCPGEETAERGYHTYLGVNSALTDPEFALESAGLGEETVLGRHEPDGQLDHAARLGADAHLS